MPAPNVNPIQDLAKAPPVLGIPIVGNILNVPSEIAANVALDVKPDQAAIGTAQQEGPIASLNQRTDISPLAKTAGVLGASFLTPGFGFLGPAGPITSDATSPLVSLTRTALGAAPKLPIVGGLFSPASSAIVNEASDTLSTLGGNLANLNGVSPITFQKTMAAYNAGALSAQDAQDILGLGTLKFNGAVSASEQVNPSSIPFTQGQTPADWYTQYANAVVDGVKKEVGYQGATARLLPSAIQQPLNKVNNLLRELQLSTGGVPATVALDQGTKAVIAGLGQYLPQDAVDLASTDTGMIAPLRQFFGPGSNAGNSLSQAAQVDPTSGLLGLDQRQGFISQMTYPQAAGTGAAVGAATGTPVGVALGALQGVLTKAGLAFGRAGTNFVDTVVRQRFVADGITGYFEHDPIVAESYTPTLLDPGIAQVKQLAGNQADTLLNQIQAQNYWVDPKTVGTLAQQLGVPASNATKIVSIWRNLDDEAETAAIKYMAESNLVFNRDTNLISLVRNLTPFPIWPVQNLPYYAKQAVRYPGIPAAVATYDQTAAQSKDQSGLTARTDYKIPILSIGGQTLYANPLNFISASSQLQEPSPPFGTPTPLDQVIQAGQSVGVNPLPVINLGLTATGLANQQQDFQNISPWSRLVNDVGQYLTGSPTFNIEALKNAPLNAIRTVVAPGSVPTVPYAEYQVRQKLADMSLQQTGKQWYTVPEFEQAMIDPSSALYQQAAQQVGALGAATFPAQKYIPFQVTTVGQTEQDVRGQKAQVNQALAGSNLPTTTQYQIRDQFPTSEGYQYIGESTPEMILHLKLNTYFELPKTSQQTYASINPDLQSYLFWSSQAKARGIKDTSVTNYLKVNGQ